MSTAAALEHLASENYRSVATSLRGGSLPLDDAVFLGRDSFQRVALWFGHEGKGLSSAALSAADHAVHIQMEGAADSLGVSAAVPIGKFDVHAGGQTCC